MKFLRCNTKVHVFSADLTTVIAIKETPATIRVSNIAGITRNTENEETAVIETTGGNIYDTDLDFLDTVPIVENEQ